MKKITMKNYIIKRHQKKNKLNKFDESRLFWDK